ncbi:MAG: hypothetical protein J6X84_09320 [Treponema sp.]|nr:hypothetical protein [Treponema sp.]
MKKIIYSALAFSLLLAFASCKSTKAASAGAKEAAAQSDFSEWNKTSRKSVSQKNGKVHLRVKSRIGSYTLSVINSEGKSVPVLSTANEFSANAFYLKTSKKAYNLVTDSAVRSSAKRSGDDILVLYQIPSVAEIYLRFSCFASQKNEEVDMVKVTASVKNIGKKNEEFILKAVLDTVLGEAANYHFYTYDNIPIRYETLYRTLENQKWFVSKNVNSAMQLFFTGADCTVPDVVAFGNYTTLEKNTWEPDMLGYRAFDTVLSYNNSAVCAIWKPMKLAPNADATRIFYIALASDGEAAHGERFIYKEKDSEAEIQEASDSELESTTEKTDDSAKATVAPILAEEMQASGSAESVEAVQAAEENAGEMESIDEPLNEPVNESVNEPLAAAVPLGEEVSEVSDSDFDEVEDVAPEDNLPSLNLATIPNVDFNVSNITKDKLSPEYIQSLIDRISALEEDSPSLNRQELLELNAELDAILNYLRQ